jgi:hypothetical protein
MSEQRIRDVAELVNEIIVEATRFNDARYDDYSAPDPEVAAIAYTARKLLIKHLERVFGGLND